MERLGVELYATRHGSPTWPLSILSDAILRSWKGKQFSIRNLGRNW